MNKGEAFECAMCRQTFTAELSGDEAEDEYAEFFPDAAASGEPRDVVCDDCWEKVRPDKVAYTIAAPMNVNTLIASLVCQVPGLDVLPAEGDRPVTITPKNC